MTSETTDARTPGAPAAATPRARTRRWSMRDLVAVAVLAAVFGFLYFALVQGWGALSVAMGPFGDLAGNVLIGGWIVVAPLALFILRRPGTGVLVEVLAAFVEFAFLGNPVGPMLLLVALVQGAGAEVAFAATRYRSYRLPVFLLSGLTAALASFVFNGFRLAWFTQDFLVARFTIQMLSGLILCGLLAFVIGKALLRTGVLDDFPAGEGRDRG